AAVLEGDFDQTKLRRDVPGPLVQIIERCLQREPRLRYASTDDLCSDLRRVAPEQRVPIRLRRVALPVVIAALLIAVIAAVLMVRRPATTSPSTTTLAAMPFRNVSGDASLTHFGLGLADAMISRLASVQARTVRPTSAIAAFESAPIAAADAGRRLRVTHVLEGTVQRLDRSTRITAQLTDVASGATVWSETLDID